MGRSWSQAFSKTSGRGGLWEIGVGLPLAGIAVLLALGVGLFVGLLLCIYYGWATAILWNWFVVPVFGVPVLTTFQAAGITFALSRLFPNQLDLRKLREEEKKSLWETTLGILTAPLISLLLGWALKHWFM